ncbi:MAG: hypothetical protein QFB87_00550 [Patescibacteria group bacterium]|nr:hypothetical protein [Patescibacteria group bacterium]
MSNYEISPELIDVRLVAPAHVEQKHQTDNIVGTTRPSLLVQDHAPEVVDDTPGVLERLSELTYCESLQEMSLADTSHELECFENSGGFYDMDDDECAEYYLLKNKFKDMRDIANLLHDTEHLDGEADLRIGYIKDLIQDYRVLSPEVNFNDEQSGSASETEDFLNYYAYAITARITEEKWADKIDGWRERYVEALDSPKLKALLPAETRRRFAEDARKAPVRITDPITSILNSQIWEAEIFGMMDPEDRTVSIDPFSANHVMNRDARTVSKLFATVGEDNPLVRFNDDANEARILKTLFHELIHYSTNEYYHLSKQHDLAESTIVEEHVSIRQSWPKFWFEGMTEKLAQLMAAEVLDYKSLPRDRTLRERSAWTETSIEPRQIGTTKKTEELTDRILVAYPEFRILIDTLFERLDWQAAGLKPAEAEKLAFRAFTDRVMPGGASGTHRMRFIEAINKAAHPGFWMKLTTLVESYGTGLMTDMLSDPKLNVHNPSGMPWLTSPQAATSAKYFASDVFIIRSLQNIDTVAHFGGTEDMVEAARGLHDDDLKKSENAKLLLAAHAGLKTILEQRHRQRTAPTPKDRLQVAIFGGRAGMELKERPVADITPARAAIAAWLKASNPDG